jgi:RNA polymerase sigma-70 factor (ECF subfamily)
VKVFQNLDKFKGESKLFSWMYRIATNESMTFLSKKSKLAGVSSEILQNKAIDNLQSDVYFDGNEIQVKLQRAIAILPEKQQLIFKMKYFEELKYEEISDILGTSVGALKASYHFAVKKIEIYLNTN